jgi:TPR repeat protein
MSHSVPWALMPDNEALQGYIDDIGQELATHAKRRGIPYQFHIVDWPVANAFAVAGGHIYITRRMLTSIESEAELAGILAHEIAHIDLKHSIQMLQYELVLRRIVGDDLAAIVRIAQHLLTVSYSEQQEREADRTGLIIMAEAGYSPMEAIRAFISLGSKLDFTQDRPAKPERPELEIGRAIEDAVEDYFATHPVWPERVRNLDAILQRNMASWKGRTFYIGRSNYRDKTSREADRREDETIVYSGDSPELQIIRGSLLERAGDFATALQIFHSLAERGYADAQYHLGHTYREGRGVPQDYAEAVKWYQRAAEQGLSSAMFSLSIMYSQGQGVSKDEAEAAKWCRTAAEHGHIKGQYCIASRYSEGRGVSQDYVEAEKWYRKAAEQGHAQAQYELGYMYHIGMGAEKDHAKAAKWWWKAADQGVDAAEDSLRSMYFYGQGLPRDTDEVAIWYREAAENVECPR